MGLSDAQIERFSRQIILPQIGGTGQIRLLETSVAIGGRGELVEIVALYLAGAGIGTLALHGAEHQQLRGQLVDLNPDVHVTVAGAALGVLGADVLVACDLPLADLDRAAAMDRPLVAGGIDTRGGWFVVAAAAGVCASCAARAAGALSGAAPRPHAAALQRGPAAGVIGSMMSLAVLKLRLGLGPALQPTWLQFDAVCSTATEHSIARAADCPTCVG